MSTPRRALVVIDVQNEYVTGNMRISHPPVEVSLPNIAAAIDTARATGIPVLTVQHDAPAGSPIFSPGSDSWQLHAVVAERQADHHINKTKASIFTGTAAADWLARHQIDTLTVIGYMTHNCDAATIYEAAHRGYKVEFLSDASGSLPYRNDAGAASAEEIHRVFSTVFHSSFAAVATTARWQAAVRDGVALEQDNVYLSHQRAL